MDMGIHEAIRLNSQLVLPCEAPQQAEIFPSVIFTEEDYLIAIALLDNVMGKVFEDDTSDAGHGRILGRFARRIKTNYGRDPGIERADSVREANS